jgi:hypothetical protein
VCYDHLAGDAGVAVYDGLVARRALDERDGDVALTDSGRRLFDALGIDIDVLALHRRPLCRACLDWSVRRHHLAGALGAALFARMLAQGWARRIKGSRAVDITPPGARALAAHFSAR